MHLAPFTDTRLWKETKANANFWQQNSFHGVDLTSLYDDARKELFGTYLYFLKKNSKLLAN